MRKPKTLTVFEYSRAFFNGDHSPISHEDARRLNVICEDLKRHVKADVLVPKTNVDNETVGVEARQFVGVIRVSNSLVVQVLPKMYRLAAEDDDEAVLQDCTQNLLFMLDYCNKLRIPHTNQSDLNKFNGNFFEILVFLFITTLKAEIQNSPHHEYVHHTSNEPFLRGKLLLTQHLRYNVINQSRFYLQNDEFTEDNLLNQVFKYVCKALQQSSQNQTNRIALGQLLAYFGGVSDRKITLEHTRRIHLTRLNARFQPALELAKLFLAGQSLQLTSNNFESLTFLIDMNELFENFVATALAKEISRREITGFSMYPQGPHRTLVEEQSSIYSGERAVYHKFNMKPDISIVRTDEPANVKHSVASIIDTKYKILDSDDAKLGVSQADMYQMYAYAHKYHTRDITLLYPLKAGEEIEQKVFYLDDSCQVAIRTIDLRRNLLSDRRFQSEIFDIAFGK